MSATSALLQEGRYRLDHPIAETNESSVFNGYDTVRDTKVVVKEIVAHLNKVTTPAQQENIKLNFVNQAKVLASIRHDSLLRVEDYFSEIGRQYLVLESVDGDDLATILAQTHLPFELEVVASWAEQLLDAVHYLHSFAPPVLHRRINPGNIIKQFDDRIKLLAYDAGDAEQPISTSISCEDTESGVLNYSPLEMIWDGLDYASQKVIVSSYDDRSEKLLKSPADTRSDIYSIGATLYHLLTAKVPVDPLERSIEMLDGRPDPLTPPNKLNPSIPGEVSDVLMRAMEIKRENRFDSAVIMRQVLRTSLGKVQDRELNEARELEEAAEDLRFAEKVREEQIQKLAEQKARELAEQQARELEAEKRRAAEELERKLREAEELRLAAEKRAADVERRLAEEEAQRRAADAALHTSQPSTPAPAVFEENLLELTVEPNSAQQIRIDEPEVVAFEEAAPAAVIELDESLPISGQEEETDEQFLIVEPEVPAVTAEPETKRRQPEEESTFSFEEAPSASKMPIVIGAFVVLLVAAVGGWFFLGSGSNSAPAPASTQSTAPAPVSQPVAPTEQPVQAPAAQTDPAQQVQPAVTEPAPGEAQPASADQSQSRTAAKPAPAKATKPSAEPAKAPEKKKVTVDDLINDN